MADDPCEDPEVVVNTFLQHKSVEQMQDYLARGRRFTTFDVRQLTKDWITAVRSWLAHKDYTKERMMDDLAAELRLRGLDRHTSLLNKSWPIAPLRRKRPSERKS